jgi:AraC-like DNA-binding protein/quercetin dioxygenase-like cupin family protein
VKQVDEQDNKLNDIQQEPLLEDEQALMPIGDTTGEHDYIRFSLNPAPGEGELTVLFSGEGRPHPLHKIGPAIHDYVLVHTVLSGRGSYRTRGQSYTCRGGDSFVIFPDELFSYQADAEEPWHYVWVSFIGSNAVRLLGSMGVTPDRPIIRGARLADLRPLYNSLQESLHQTDDPALADLEASGWLRLILVHMGRICRGNGTHAEPDTAAIDRQIEQAIRFMSLHYTQPVSIEQLSRTLGYHRTHLSRMFKRTTGLSPKQYLMQIRLERAQTLLSDTSMPIDQVASGV